MKRFPLRALLPFLLVTPLVTLGASPNVSDGPANLRAAVGGDVLATLDTGTPLTVSGAECSDGDPWLEVSTTDGQQGWMSAALVSLGDGAGATSPADRSIDVHAQPAGDVLGTVAAGQPMAALEASCADNVLWLHVKANGLDGWTPGAGVTLGTAAVASAPAPTPQPSTPAAPSAAVPYHAASPEYGMGIFAWGNDAAAILARVKTAGFGWQKSLIAWRDVEGKGKGQLDWSGSDAVVQASQRAGIKMLARVDFEPAWARADGANNGPPDNYQDYADFLRALATRYKSGSPYGHVDAIEVWNEPNLSREWGEQPVNQQSAADYVRLLSAAYDAVKSVDPSIMVVTAGLSPTGWNDDTARPDDTFLQWMYDAGLKGHYDALGAHAPGFKAPPEVSPEEAAASPAWGGHRSFTFRRVEDLRAIMEENGDADRQVWVTEFGWTSDTVHPAYAWHAVSEEQKADYLVRAFAWAHDHWAPWIGPMIVWTMADPTWGPQDEQYWWSVTNPDGSPCPAYLALQAARAQGSLP